MRATGDFAEERLGMSRLFQTDQRRESLAVERKLAKGIAVGGDISRKEDGSGQQRFGLGQRLTDPKPERSAFRSCRP